MSTLPTKNLIFLHDLHNNFKFLVDSGASILILLHSSTAPPTGPHLVGVNCKAIPAWGSAAELSVSPATTLSLNFYLQQLPPLS
jgi:hypothetical protein